MQQTHLSWLVLELLVLVVTLTVPSQASHTRQFVRRWKMRASALIRYKRFGPVTLQLQ